MLPPSSTQPYSWIPARLHRLAEARVGDRHHQRAVDRGGAVVADQGRAAVGPVGEGHGRRGLGHHGPAVADRRRGGRRGRVHRRRRLAELEDLIVPEPHERIGPQLGVRVVGARSRAVAGAEVLSASAIAPDGGRRKRRPASRRAVPTGRSASARSAAMAWPAVASASALTPAKVIRSSADRPARRKYPLIIVCPLSSPEPCVPSRRNLDDEGVDIESRCTFVHRNITAL